jgi:hypothetical protein
VNWSAEQECFQGVAMELAEFYAIKPANIEALALVEAMQKPSSSSDTDETKPLYPVHFIKQNKDDHPLHRAIQFTAAHPESYLFGKEYPESSSAARYYIAQEVEAFFQEYCKMSPNQRIFGIANFVCFFVDFFCLLLLIWF